TTVQTTTTSKSAISRRLTVSRGPNEVVSSKQLGVPTKYELQQYVVLAKYERHHSRPQNANRASVGSSNLPLQTIPNSRGNASVVTLRSGKELPLSAPQQSPRPTDANFVPGADS
ncbi:hypothetical protein CR513_07198, partial [Mucuna pruriens]